MFWYRQVSARNPVVNYDTWFSIYAIFALNNHEYWISGPDLSNKLTHWRTIMKKAALALVVAATLGMSACQQQEMDVLKVEVQTLETEQQKQSYAFGASIGGYVEQRYALQEEVGIELDKDLVVKGFIAGLQKQSQLEPEELDALNKAIEESMKTAMREKEQAAAQENVAAGEAFMAENGKREGVTTTASGLQYEVLSEGEGAKPAAEDTVKVHYKGTLLDGTEFDSSYSRNEPAVFPLNRVIAGWTEGLQYMSEGAKYKFVIPSNLAYGSRATGKITPNSTLVFEVELLEVQKKEAAE